MVCFNRDSRNMKGYLDNNVLSSKLTLLFAFTAFFPNGLKIGGYHEVSILFSSYSH